MVEEQEKPRRMNFSHQRERGGGEEFKAEPWGGSHTRRRLLSGEIRNLAP